MPLPKLKYPTFFDKIPSTKEIVEYRPFLVKEQKVLLIASESGDQKSIKEAMKKTLQACIISKINIYSFAFALRVSQKNSRSCSLMSAL